MKRRSQLITWFVLLSGLYVGAAGNAHAISEAYRKQLEASGCTQVSEANGTCQLHQSRPQPDNAQASQRSGPALPGPAAEVATSLKKRVAGKYQEQAMYIMQREGWEQANSKGTQWRKAGFVAELAISQHTNKVTGVIVK